MQKEQHKLFTYLELLSLTYKKYVRAVYCAFFLQVFFFWCFCLSWNWSEWGTWDFGGLGTKWEILDKYHKSRSQVTVEVLLWCDFQTW